MKARLFAILALAIPILVGLAFMAAFGAPQSYLIINAATLATAAAWIWFGRWPIAVAPSDKNWVAPAVLLANLTLPLLTGPYINGVSRWLPLGPFQLHAGMVVIPSLVAIAATQRDNAPIMLLLAVLVAVVQPDAAVCFAIFGAAVGLYFAWHEWKPGVVAGAAFLAGIYASIRGELPPQEFVERVIVSAYDANGFIALALLGSLLISFFLMLFSLNAPPAVRYALAGSMAGFSITAVLSNYPSIFIGYGAAPIIGYALALGLHWRDERGAEHQ